MLRTSQRKSSHLAKLREKSAAIGGDPERSFEQAFATLAYTYIEDRAPRLLDYLVGFQLVDRNEDNTRAVGIFGFQLGKQWIYVPTFFLNGDLKGHELMYLKDSDQFVPLAENWVNYVLGKQPHILGESSPQTLEELGVMQPDLRQLSIPPGSNKFSSVQVKIPEGIEDWAIPALPWTSKLATTNPFKLPKYTGLDERLTLPKLMGESLTLCKMAMRIRRQYPDIAGAMDGFFGTDAIRDAVLELRTKAATALKMAGPDILNPNRASRIGETQTELISILRGPEPVKEAVHEKVQVVVDSDVAITVNRPYLDEQQQEKLLRDGQLVVDRRTGEETSIAYNVQVEVELVNPDATGMYDVLTKPGTFQRCLIISHPYSDERREDFCTVIRLDPRNWLNAHRSCVWVKPVVKNEREQFKGWFEDQGKADLKKKGLYVAVCADGTGTVPFKVREKVGDGRYRVYCETCGTRRPKYLPKVMSRETNPWDDTYWGENFIELNAKKGTKFRIAQGTIFVPEDAKIIEVKKPPKPKKEDDRCESYPEPTTGGQSENPPIEPGNIADIQLGIVQKMSVLKLFSNGNEISVDRKPLQSPRGALIELITKYGFREKAARTMIGQAQRARARGKAARFYVKYAQPYPLMVGPGPNAPSIPDPQMTTDQAYAPVPAHYPEAHQLPVDDMSAQHTDPAIYDNRPEATPDPMSMQTAQQAAQTGQKEVFDTSMISGLLKTVRQDSLVSRYLGDLFKALDRLGRLLFSFYWHNDEFAERYGKSDLPELEDTLRNTYENLGDLVLFLKEKDVAPMPGTELGEPEIEDAAD